MTFSLQKIMVKPLKIVKAVNDGLHFRGQNKVHANFHAGI